jgi:hypothetical protein
MCVAEASRKARSLSHIEVYRIVDGERVYITIV